MKAPSGAKTVSPKGFHVLRSGFSRAGPEKTKQFATLNPKFPKKFRCVCPEYMGAPFWTPGQVWRAAPGRREEKILNFVNFVYFVDKKRL